MKKLPIGIQTFSKIRLEDYYYVDKTKILKELVDSGSYYFLSRPRRFGKSLFLDTLREAFLGNKELFRGLYLENNWDWSEKYPVIHIDFGTGVLKTPGELDQRITEALKEVANRDQISFQSESISGKFRELIIELEKKYSKRVVILIDEYDKPILDNITETGAARGMRDGLRNFYSVIKGADAYIKFVFLTGVSKFSKVNLFSGLNNLQDITLDKRYATICGYSESELTVFEEMLEGVDRAKLRRWYNGYNFMGDSVYNPFDILLFLGNKEYKGYWFETGNPSFLIDLIEKKKYNTISINKIRLTDTSLSGFDIDSIELENLLFQTGYLTIKDTKEMNGNRIYYLQYPNYEVKASLTDVILKFLAKDSQPKENNKINLYEILQDNNLQKLKDVFYSFFASIPHDWYRKNTIANYEGYYSSIFYCYFTALGLDVRAEDVTNHGQVDMTVFFENRVYVFEFKVIEMTEPGSALAQIKEKKYYEKYLNPSNSPLKESVYLIGVEFSRDNRNITNYEWEELK
ncbi:MAG: ATP-binding protein [Leptospiraceae bacterium]|nr:ATP-binding protein [Leptospiraceae bacterium]